MDLCAGDGVVAEEHREAEAASVRVEEVVVVVLEASRGVEVVGLRREGGVVPEEGFREEEVERVWGVDFEKLALWDCVWYMAANGCYLDFIKKTFAFYLFAFRFLLRS